MTLTPVEMDLIKREQVWVDLAAITKQSPQA